MQQDLLGRGGHHRDETLLIGLTTLMIAVAAVWVALGPEDSPPAPPPQQAAGDLCALVASPDGDDSASGSWRRPVRTVGQLVDKLGRGQTGCLRAGSYGSAGSETRLDKAQRDATLRSWPGERAKLRGRVVILAPGFTLRGLDLDGDCGRRTCLPSPSWSAPDVRIAQNDITNGHTGICVSPDRFRGQVPDRFVIESNRVHDCGNLPADNHHHGIYVNAGTGGAIHQNVIFDNADRGVQLFPAARSTLVAANTIDGNGQGANFGGRSSLNTYEDNVIANSRVRWNLEWDTLSGSGNAARSNCFSTGGRRGRYGREGGIQDSDRQLVGLASNTVVADPGYRDRARGDFRLGDESKCRGKGASGDVLRPR